MNRGARWSLTEIACVAVLPRNEQGLTMSSRAKRSNLDVGYYAREQAAGSTKRTSL